jgi:hypothetical protein
MSSKEKSCQFPPTIGSLKTNTSFYYFQSLHKHIYLKDILALLIQTVNNILHLIAITVTLPISLLGSTFKKGYKLFSTARFT